MSQDEVTRLREGLRALLEGTEASPSATHTRTAASVGGEETTSGPDEPGLGAAGNAAGGTAPLRPSIKDVGVYVAGALMRIESAGPEDWGFQAGEAVYRLRAALDVIHQLDKAERPRALDFATLREVNVRRCEAVFFSLNRWNALEWAGALCGEAGEAANFCKKIVRGDTPKIPAQMIEDVANELADVVCYADLLAAYLKVDLGRAVIKKFNEVSARRGSPIRLGEP